MAGKHEQGNITQDNKAAEVCGAEPAAAQDAAQATTADVSPTGERTAEPKKLYYDSAEEALKAKKAAKAKRRTGLSVFTWILAAIVILALSLIISSMIAGFESVFEMIAWIMDPANTVQ